MKIKLTKKFKEKYLAAVNEVNATSEQLSTYESHMAVIRAQSTSAQRHLLDVIEMIGEANGINTDFIAKNKSGYNFSVDKDDNLVIENANTTASQKIKEKLKKAKK